MAEAHEEQLLIESGNNTLSSVIYVPDGTPSSSVLFCNPLFEERKSSQRILVDCARALRAQGCMVLRFDYRGCGDSQGDFHNFTVPDWLEDVKHAADLLNERSGTVPLGTLGLRLGGNLTVRSGLPFDFYALWEPIPEGNAYLEHELRRKVLREMVTFGEGRSSRKSSADKLEAGETIDLDGYELTPALAASVRGLSLVQDMPANGTPLYLANVTHGSEPAKEMLPVREALKEHNQTFEVIREQPFWNKIGLTEPTDLIQKTASWIKNNK